VHIDYPQLWPETAVTLHVWTPPGTDGLSVQAITGVNNYGDYQSGPPITLNRGDWTPLRVTVQPADITFPGGIQQLIVKFAVYAGSTFAGGDFYIDAIAAKGGVAECSGSDDGNQNFEESIEPWEVADNCVNTDIEWATDQVHGGTHSLKVTFTNFPMGTPATPITCPINLPIGAGGPNAYCGDTITAYVWTPTGSDALSFQLFGNYNNYAGFTASSPAAITRNGWTSHDHTLPPIGPGGLQRIGVEFINTGPAFTGSVYIDDVTW